MKRIRLHCDDVALHICENLDQNLDSRKCRQIRKHLKECPNCSAYLDSLKKTVSLYRRVKNPRVQGKTHLKLQAMLNLSKE